MGKRKFEKVLDTDEFPIQRAVKKGNLDKVRQLIERGVSVDSCDCLGWTPLHWAAKKGQQAVVELLVRSKCNLNQKDRRGRTPVYVAAESCNKNIVTLLLQHGAQVSCADVDMHTLLHYASIRGWTDVVRSILDRGEADPNAATHFYGTTPLVMAAQKGYDGVAVLLLRAGADVNRSYYSEKMTVLHFAAENGHTRVVQVLLEQEGIDLNPQDKLGQTPLHKACSKGRREVVMQLLVAGADASIKDNVGDTALSVHIRRGGFTLEDIRLFVQHGAFLQDCDYVCISVLKDVDLCTQSIVNKFHCQSLPALKSITYFARKLPNTEKFKLNSRQVDEVENLVRCEIGRNTFCNVVKAHPMALSALCVLSLITCQSGAKRSATPNLSDSNSFKKLLT